MYYVICCSSRVIVKRFLSLQYAKDWAMDNNYLEGEPYKLFEVVSEKFYNSGE